MAWLEIVRSGALTTVQDRGRAGDTAAGISESGAVDRTAHDAANRLVGNDPAAATLEVTAGGLEVRSIGSTIVAVTGARVDVTVNGRPHGDYAMLHLRDGDILTLGAPSEGVRTYVAVRGGIDVPEVLGSRATDTRSGTGPPPVAIGDRLLAGALAADLPVECQIPPPVGTPDPAVLRVHPGPQEHWFSAGSVRALFRETWSATSELDRSGIRLHGPGPLHRSSSERFPGEATVAGALQVPRDGHPILLLADHPAVGDYPVIAVVVPGDVHIAAQLRPGHHVQFRRTP
ncbi:MAG: biotin-dependent carboxyltransferase family protein [Rhodococcus sp. (in: high G+C Gram-positive bacteria)]|uniref:5-oxoprolinase subunit C family protein n=1 Tax=Rhodococcus sp. TaxID=1831 RepID=UPI003BB523B7